MSTIQEPLLPPYTEHDSSSQNSGHSNSDHDDNDLLPSFELHNFIFNRNLIDEVSPDYQESVPTTCTPSINQCESIASTEQTLNNDNVLDNLDKLQKIDVPFEVKVTFTKEFPMPFEQYQVENPLRQYYPGDMVYGFVTFENKGTAAIPFEMLLISLECEIGILSPKNNNPIRKKIIAMYDLEASYNFLKKEKFCYACHQLDPVDNTHMGFKTRVLEPGYVVKKLFKFKLPTYLLDDNCCEQFSEHLQIPPSFGIDSLKFPQVIVDPSKGYGSISKSGTPIKVEDFAMYGEFCQYFINIQIIGKKLDAYKAFYKSDTKHIYDYIFLKNVEHSFRVGKLQEHENVPISTISTKSQLCRIQNIAKETIEILQEREMLMKIGMVDMKDQDEVIFSTSGKLKTALELPLLDCSMMSKCKLDTSFKHTLKFDFKRELFSKLNGELIVTTKMISGSTVESFLPKLLETKANNIYTDLAFRKDTSPVINLELEFHSYDESTKLPTTLSIEPVMKAIDVESAFDIPFTIDDDFVIQDQDTVKLLFQKCNAYHGKIGELMKRSGLGIPKATNRLLNSMGYIRYQEIPVPRIFKSHTFDLPIKKWIYDKTRNTYKMSLQLSLEYDIPDLIIHPKALIPSFQTCKFARKYKMQLNISPKKNKLGSVIFPLAVV